MGCKVFSQNNAVFNHDFTLPGQNSSFPAGWSKGRGGRNSNIYWEKDGDDYSIRMKNTARQTLSISQQRLYGIPVHEGQVWEAGLQCSCEKSLALTITIHFFSYSARISSFTFNFVTDPLECYVHTTLTIPAQVHRSWLEVSLHTAGTVRLEDVVFSKVFPTNEYSIDSQGRLNINSVESVQQVVQPVVVDRIIEPVQFRGRVETVRHTVNYSEDVYAKTMIGFSKVQQVLDLNMYSVCVVNLDCVSSAKVHLQLSPDNIHWIDDSPVEYSVKPGEGQILVSNTFLRFIRVAFAAQNEKGVKLRIFFQGNS